MIKKIKPIICWWSGGITSAVACRLAIDIYGIENCRVIMLDTKNEDDDTYRFKRDCEKWYGIKIESLSAIPNSYSSIQETWYRHRSLNTASGAICSYKLKRVVREKWEKKNEFSFQVFGFEFSKWEFKRATSFALNHKNAKPIFPLLMMGYDKEDCIKIVTEAGIEIPRAYSLGFNNNNCLKTGCCQGGIGYWKKMKEDFPEKFEAMAKIEHDLTNLKGQPVTMLKDQSNKTKKFVSELKENEDPRFKTINLVFLKKNPRYPNNKCIDDMRGRKVKPLTDCNGFCGVEDLSPKNETIDEINFDKDADIYEY